MGVERSKAKSCHVDLSFLLEYLQPFPNKHLPIVLGCSNTAFIDYWERYFYLGRAKILRLFEGSWAEI